VAIRSKYCVTISREVVRAVLHRGLHVGNGRFDDGEGRLGRRCRRLRLVASDGKAQGKSHKAEGTKQKAETGGSSHGGQS
jgi:hypothetical protein